MQLSCLTAIGREIHLVLFTQDTPRMIKMQRYIPRQPLPTCIYLIIHGYKRLLTRTGGMTAAHPL